MIKSFERIIGVPGVKNLGKVSDNIYRCAEPEGLAGFIALKLLHIKTVLNFETANESFIASLGYEPIFYPLTGLSKITVKQGNDILRHMINPDNWPIIFHCKYGKDRTGYACAIYRLAIDGWTLKQTKLELEAYGYHKALFWIDESIDDFAESIGVKE